MGFYSIHSIYNQFSPPANEEVKIRRESREVTLLTTGIAFAILTATVGALSLAAAQHAAIGPLSFMSQIPMPASIAMVTASGIAIASDISFLADKSCNQKIETPKKVEEPTPAPKIVEVKKDETVTPTPTPTKAELITARRRVYATAHLYFDHAPPMDMTKFNVQRAKEHGIYLRDTGRHIDYLDEEIEKFNKIRATVVDFIPTEEQAIALEKQSKLLRQYFKVIDERTKGVFMSLFDA